MNWFRQNRFLGFFLIALVAATLLSAYFLFHEKSAADEAQARLDSTIAELTRLRGTTPFPNEENLGKLKMQFESYGTSLQALETELKTRMFPRPPLQPNEFQAQLRQAVTAVTERARASRVQLPDNFNLGFDEYATSLPNGLAAPRLGRQLRAIEWIANTVIESHVDSLQSLIRSPLPEEKEAATPTPAPKSKPGAPAKNSEVKKIVDSTSIDLAFACSPAAARRVFNQVGAAKEQAYVIRTLQVHNQADKGPKRAQPGEAEPAAAAAAAKQGGKPGIIFIVGTEHLNVAMRVEILRFNFPEKETR